jgi:hypothetical protein
MHPSAANGISQGEKIKIAEQKPKSFALTVNHLPRPLPFYFHQLTFA